MSAFSRSLRPYVRGHTQSQLSLLTSSAAGFEALELDSSSLSDAEDKQPGELLLATLATGLSLGVHEV